ncbi:MAG: valine--tRNA ligase, partial [Anaerolineales bacterium]|nr:valine--tRNA ligase [Anaerolineales bacterium]
WSPGLKTAVSDLEVEYEEEDATLYYFKYMLKDSDEYIPVATIRPETILGDTAVAVHPKDQRYEKYVGRRAIVPVLGREIPVIEDDYVSLEFGTGALKVTPGHDPNDYDIAQRHNLPVISMLDTAACINENGGPYQGLDRFEGRRKLWADMESAGLAIKTEPYRTTIPRSQRGGEIVEPMISTQWFVKIQPLADAALAAVKDGRIRIVPERFEKVYFNWLENIKDWCISRQLWWGHRIPVWYCADCGKTTAPRIDPSACSHCGSVRIEQDPDVLDTWFSSGLWPFSTLGWPEETPDYQYFYPTSVMETGYDILFFWVARMIMDGLEFTGQVPFHTVYLHGLIRDEAGTKMSKSFGNVIDPLTVMDEYGTDALRFTLLVGSTPGNDTNVSVKRVEANRNFANKIWNAGRFVLSAIEAVQIEPSTGPDWTLADSWIRSGLHKLVREVERLFQVYQYGEAGRQIYDFIWGDFADWYVEIAKLQMAEGGERAFYTAQTLAHVLDVCLRLLHPFTPFVTEELWGHLRRALLNSELRGLAADWSEVLVIASWPEPRAAEGWEADKMVDFALLQEIIRAIRNVRAEKNVKADKRIPATLAGGKFTGLLQMQAGNVAALAGLDPSRFRILETLVDKPKDQIALVISGVEAYLPLAELVNLEAERSRMEKEMADIDSQIARLEKLLSSDFAKKAPEGVIQKEQERLKNYREMADKLRSQLA